MIPAVYSLVIRLGMPESVRFLETKGRHEEAERIVRDFEASAGIGAETQAVPHSPEAPTAPLPAPCWMTIKAISEGSTSLRVEVGEPADLRLTLTFGG